MQKNASPDKTTYKGNKSIKRDKNIYVSEIHDV